MSYCEFSGVKISGVACALPTQIIDNSKTSGISQKEIARFIKNMGVKYRRCAVKKQTSSDLGFEAAKKILETKNIDPKSIDGLIFLTQNPDYRAPSTAFVLAHRLGLGKDCMAFDVNIGCAAFNYGVHMASSFIAGAKMKKVLVIIADVIKDDWGGKRSENSRGAMLFGDCGSAVLLENSSLENSVIKSLLRSDGDRYSSIITRNGWQRHPVDDNKRHEQVYSQMDGEGVMTFGITDVPNTINEFLDITKSKIDDFDKILLHQSNEPMIKIIAEKIGAKLENVPVSIVEYGNVSGSTVPLTLVDAMTKKSTKLPKTLKILACSFGVGLSWGVNSFFINSDDILPLIETDEFYKEAF